MQRGIEHHPDANIPIIETVRAFSTIFNNQKAFNAQIKSANGGQKSPRIGFARDKRASKMSFCNKTLKIANPIHAFAKYIGDNPLRDKVNYIFSKINRLCDDQSAPRYQIIHNHTDDQSKLISIYKSLGGMTSRYPNRERRSDVTVSNANEKLS